MSDRPPLDYESPSRSRESGRSVPISVVGAGIGLISLSWALVALFIPLPLIGRPAAMMIASGVFPSALVGLLIASIAARGRLGAIALLANLLALVCAAWVVIQGL